MSLTTTLRLRLNTELVGTQGASSPQDSFDETFSDSLDDGNAVDQANQEWHDTRSLGSGASETLDLSGTLTNGLGQTVDFTKIKGWWIQNSSSNVGDILVVGAAAADKWEGWTTVTGSTFRIGPGGAFLMWDPSAAAMAVAAGSTDKLKIANSGTNTVSYKIRIIGVE